MRRLALGNKKPFILLVGALILLLAVIFIGDHKSYDSSDHGPTKEYSRQVIGTSIEGRNIEAHTYGSGDTHLVFVGGIHGGYEWNTIILADRFISYFKENPTVVPENLKVTFIPSANPDGVFKIIGKDGSFTAHDVPNGVPTAPGRFNANGVDLNRNFGCKWSPEGVWRGERVGTGSSAFSEPEARAIRDFVYDSDPRAVIFWHSQANTVYASECRDGVLPETRDIMMLYAEAANYNAVESFDAYEVNGDAEGWLASIGIPAITVELETHETIEWERNLRGVQALFEHYSS